MLRSPRHFGVWCLLVFAPSFAKNVTWSNIGYRVNKTGEIMDAHDGSYNQWTPGGPWYYYAMGYGTCKQGQDMCHGCGYGYSWIGVWRSPDMSNNSWTLLRDARDGTWPKCTYFRVHVVYNIKTQLYVLWVNLNGGPADYAVGTSAHPEGPFQFVNAVDVGRKSGGDFDILVDDDGSGYIIYTATELGHTMTVERLTEDFLASAASSSQVPNFSLMPQSAAVVLAQQSNVSSGVFGLEFVEAPVFFKRNGIYYALFGNCCCFCGHGSGIGVYTASSPLGPFAYHDNIGCLANTTLSQGCGCGMVHKVGTTTCNFYGQSLTKAQQNFVIRIPQPGGKPDQFVWTGDMWQSAADGIKAHDRQYWSVLRFENVGGIELPMQFTWEDTIEISVN